LSRRRRYLGVALGVLLLCAPARAQQGAPAPPPRQAALKDTLGRETPRGTVLGFMNAARNGRDDIAPLYLNTTLRDQPAADLARKLFVVLDSRLPPRLKELSDRPEGSLSNPIQPDRDVVGAIATPNGSLELVVERVNRGALGQIWLFSRKTLDAIPEVYAETDLVPVDRFLPAFLTRPRIGGIRLFEWLALGLLPIGYRLTGLLSRLLRVVLAAWHRRRGRKGELPAEVVPGFVRFLLLSIAIRWLLTTVDLPLLERLFWSAIATMLGIGAVIWALLLLNGVAERHIRRRLRAVGHGGTAAMLRLARRIADVLIIAAGGLVTLAYFGVDPTAALAGLGIGGIAVALAAQKTLENVIGGLSIIFDKAVRVGDFLKLGDTLGTVDDIGLRSTRIRTLDRTILSVPNGQIANANIETLSARDKFWFRHVVGLRYETTAAQMRVVLAGVRSHLAAHPAVDAGEPIRVRFFRLGAFSLDIEIFAYVFAADWDAFLGTQQDMLLDIMEIIERAGAVIALPAQVLHVDDASDRGSLGRAMSATRSALLGAAPQPAGSA
jgi:MscS family membrane protein